MMGEMVSVVVPTYNREKQIERAIRSVLKQTYDNYEIIVVDDGSTDSTQEVVEQIADNRIHYIRLAHNHGACHARNVGVQSSRSDYIAFLDSDDEWMSDKLELQMRKIMESSENTGLVYCRMSGESRDQEKRNICPSYDWPNDVPLEGDLFRVLLWRNFIGTPTMLVRKSCLLSVGGFDETLRCLQDWELVLRIARKWYVGFVDKVLVEVHKTANSVSSDVKEHFRSRCYMVSKYYREMDEIKMLEDVKKDIIKNARVYNMQEEVQAWLGNEMVSIIIPTYNRAEVIGRAVASILRQTYDDFEIIIVDDGSVDNTQEIVEGINDDRIRYIRLEHNQGACHARNVGIQASKHRYIAFLDSDDEWLPDKLEFQMRKMMDASENVGLVYCRMSRERDDGRERIYTPPYECRKDLLEGNMFRFLLWRNVIGTPTILVRRECLEDVGGFKDSLPCLQDYELVLRIAKRWQIAFVDQVLLEVHKTANSISSKVAERLVVQSYLISKYRQEMMAAGTLELVKADALELADKNGIREEIEELMNRDFEL